MRVFAVDPGTEESAFVRYDTETKALLEHGREPNRDLVLRLRRGRPWEEDVVAIEMIASYGMAVGKEVFATCVWIGRYLEALRGPALLVYRRDVKLTLCGSSRAKDPNVRASIIDRFGPGKDKAVGSKRVPGPLFGVKRDCWAALGVAITAAEHGGEVVEVIEDPNEEFIEREAMLLIDQFQKRRRGALATAG